MWLDYRHLGDGIEIVSGGKSNPGSAWNIADIGASMDR